VLLHPLFAADVTFTTVSGLHAINIGEYVLASILAWSRHLPELLNLQHKSEWPSRRWECCQPSELRGATIGIVAMVASGEWAGLPKRLGCASWRSSATSGRAPSLLVRHRRIGRPHGALPDAIYGPDQLHAMLAQCDYVVIAVPLTPETRNMIGEAELRAMKPTAYWSILRAARCATKRRSSGRCKENGSPEPVWTCLSKNPCKRQPALAIANVILTPHISGFSPNYEQRSIDIFCENLHRYLAGQPLLNVVDKTKGY